MSQPPVTQMTDMTPTQLTGDAAALVGILEWMQSAGLDVASVSVGSCRVELRPPAAAARPDRDDAEDEGERNREAIYRKFGGPVFDHAMSDVPAGELQPAIGRTR